MSVASPAAAPDELAWPAPLLLGATGMALGLAVDLHALGPTTLASVCVGAERELWAALRLHWCLLPWMHVGMCLGGLASLPPMRADRSRCGRWCGAALARGLPCLAWMTAGMALGGWAVGRFGGDAGVAPMLAGMLGGMAGAMILGTALDRRIRRLAARRHDEAKRSAGG